MIVYLILLVLVLGEAVQEALHDRGDKSWGKVVEYVTLGLGLFITASWVSSFYPTRIAMWIPEMSFWRVVGLYVSIRVAFFRGTWNLVFFDGEWPLSKRYFYIGITDLYDDFLSWVCFKSPIKPPPEIFLPVWEGMWFLLSIGFVIGTIIK